MFWILASVLIALGVTFTAWPLLRSTLGPDAAADRQSLMRALYRDRIAELESEAEAGQLDPDARAQVVEELGANLLDEYRAEAAAASQPRAGSLLAVWLVAVALPLAGVGVYLSVGEPAAMEVAGASQVLRLDPHTQRPELEAWRERLARRVDGRPEDGQSWYLLGISRLQLGEFATAADALGRAHALVGGDPNIDLYRLQARHLAAGGSLDEQSRTIATGLLEGRPNHPMVLEMFAVDAYRRGDFRAAVEYLNRLLSNPLAPGQLSVLLDGLAQARSRMGDLDPSVDVDVGVPEGAPREGTLFVIARPPGGGMPYAVVRRPANLLPLSVRLDDTVSMSRELQLSDAPEFEVVVRLSRAGAPTAAPGDWEWRSEVLQVADLTEPVRLKADLAPRG